MSATQNTDIRGESGPGDDLPEQQSIAKRPWPGLPMLNWPATMLSVVAGAAAVVVIAVLCWGLSRGFDFTDEGLYVLRFSDPDAASPLFLYEYLFRPLEAVTHLGVVKLRLLRLVLTVGSSLIFASGLRQWMAAQTSLADVAFLGRLPVTSFILVGSLISYAYFPIALSYNTLTQINLQFVAGFALLALAHAGVDADRSRFGALTALGFFTCAQLFIKFTVGALVTVAIVLLIGAAQLSAKRWRELWRTALALPLGMSLALGYHWIVSGRSAIAWYGETSRVIGSLEQHDPSTLLAGYRVDMMTATQNAITGYYPVLLILAGIGLVAARRLPWLLVTATILLLVVYFGKLTYSEKWYLGGTINVSRLFQPFVIFACVLLALTLGSLTVRPSSATANSAEGTSGSNEPLRSTRSIAATVELLLVIGFLVALPLCASAGTANQLTVQVTQYLVFWFGFFLILAGLVARRSRVHALVAVTLLLWPICLAFTQTVHGYIWSPYRLNGSLFDQTESVTIRNGERIRLDRIHATFLKDLQATLQGTGFAPGDPMIAVNRGPGIVYALGGRSPGPSWYALETPDRSCHSLRNSDPELLDRLVILTEGELDAVLVTCLEELGLNVSSDYVTLDEVYRDFSGLFVALLMPTQMAAAP